jgi:protein tyrosine/serine phosphatase
MKRIHNNLWRGPRPTDLHEMQRLGFTRIISLQSGVQDRYTDSLLERQRKDAKAFGIDYVYIRCRNWLPPIESQVREALRLLEDTSVKTYIHCHAGVDRTGFMCAVYRMRQQSWSFQQAVDEWKAEGRHWWFCWWTPFLKRWSVDRRRA